MKLFGNSKSQKRRAKEREPEAYEYTGEQETQEFHIPEENPEQFSEKNNSPEEQNSKNEPAEKRKSRGPRAIVWLFAGILVFLCSVVMCIVLIVRSAESTKQSNIEMHVEDIQYELGDSDEGSLAGTTPETSVVETEDTELELTAPVSKNKSDILNILLVGMERKSRRTDTMVVLSVDMKNREAAFLSIPKDTYVTGDFEIPKINQIFAESGNRGIETLMEKIKDMFGFELDYHFIFDEGALARILDLTGGLEFNVPSGNDYHGFSSGIRNFHGKEAFRIFNYEADYTDVESESTEVQRAFLSSLLDALVKDQEHLIENAEAVCEAGKTDLDFEELAYLGNLLRNCDFRSAYSNVLPGEAVDTDNIEVFQVEPEEALEILNEHFNPLEKDLGIFKVNFRQKQTDSGEGEMPDWGFHNSTSEKETEEESTSAESDSTDVSSDSSDTSSGEPTEPTEGTSTEPAETPTETQPETPTEPVTEPQAPTEATTPAA